MAGGSWPWSAEINSHPRLTCDVELGLRRVFSFDNADYAWPRTVFLSSRTAEVDGRLSWRCQCARGDVKGEKSFGVSFVWREQRSTRKINDGLTGDRR